MPRLVIDDNTPIDAHTSEENRLLCGTLPRKIKYGDVPCAVSATVPTIPMEEWPDLIADLNRKKATLKDVWRDSKIGVLHQGTIKYCHGFSAVSGVMLEREIMGLPYVELSPSSVAAPVTGFTNAGAYIEDDLKQMTEVGVCDTGFVPLLTTNGRDFKPGWKANAAKTKVTLWGEVRPRNLQQHVSAILAGKPVPVARSWWAHAILDLVVHDLNTGLRATDENRYGIEFLNSWGVTYGDGGFGIVSGSRKYADSAYVIEQISLGE